MTTEQEEAEAKKAAATDSSAMEKLMGETLDQEPAPPEPPTDPKPPEQPQPQEPTPPPAVEPPAPPSGAAPPDIKPQDTPAEHQDDFEKDLHGEKYEPPAGATRNQREILKAVKDLTTQEHRAKNEAIARAEKAEKEVSELRTKVAAVEKDTEELRRYRPIVEQLAIERDPQFNARYDQRVAGIEKRVIDNLLSWGLEEDTAKYIMANGGPHHFSRDSVSTVDASPEQEGGQATRMSHKQFWEERVVKHLSSDNQTSLRLAFDDELRVKEAKDAALRNALANRDQYFKDQQETSEKNQKAFQTECAKQLEARRKELGDLVNERAIPEKATPEERKSIEAHNAAVKTATAEFDKYFLDTTPAALVEKTMGGLLLKHLPTLLAAEQAKTAAVQSKLDELQKKWDASLRAANTSTRQSVQQQPKKVEGIEAERDDGKRMEMELERLPA